MDNKSRIRINLANRELELEGPENFLDKYQTVIEQFIEKLKEEEPQNPSLTNSGKSNNESSSFSVMPDAHGVKSQFILPDTFGEFYAHYAKTIKVVDKMLIAGFFAQSKSEDGLFTPGKAAELLNEQNVHVTNPSVFIKALQNSNKLYKQAGQYKVHEKGIEYIKELYNN